MTALPIILILVYLLIGLFWAVEGYTTAIENRDGLFHKLTDLGFFGHLYIFVFCSLMWGPVLIKLLWKGRKE